MWKTWFKAESKVKSPIDVSIAEGTVSPNNDDLLKKQLGERFLYTELYAIFEGNKNAAHAQVRRWKEKGWIIDDGKVGKYKQFHNLLYVRE